MALSLTYNLVRYSYIETKKLSFFQQGCGIMPPPAGQPRVCAIGHGMPCGRNIPVAEWDGHRATWGDLNVERIKRMVWMQKESNKWFVMRVQHLFKVQSLQHDRTEVS